METSEVAVHGRSPKTEQLEKWHGDLWAVRLQMALVREDVISEGLCCTEGTGNIVQSDCTWHFTERPKFSDTTLHSIFYLP